MKETKLELIVGIFVLIGLAALAYLAIKLGKLEVVGTHQHLGLRLDDITESQSDAGPPHIVSSRCHRSPSCWRLGNQITRSTEPGQGNCGIGSSGGRRPRLADYVAEMKPTGRAIAAGRVLELATL